MSESPVVLGDGSPAPEGGAATPDNDKTRFRMPPPAAARDASGRGVSAPEAAARKATAPSVGGSTGSGWGDPALWADAGPVPGVGSVINNRFVLEE